MRERLGSITVSEAAAWWLGEMSFLVPRKVRALFGGKSVSSQLLVAGDRVTLLQNGAEVARIAIRDQDGRLRSDGKPRRIRASLRASDRAADVLLPPEKLLQTVMSLPASEIAAARGSIEKRMDRITPFTTEEVAFDYRIVESDVESQNVRLEVFVATRRDVDEAVRRAEFLGAVVSRVGGEESDQNVNLLAPSKRRQRRAPFGLLNRLLLGLAVLGLLGLVAIDIQSRRQQVRALDATVEKLRGEARAAVEVEDRIKALQDRVEALVDRRAASSTATELLAEITRLLPDDTFLEDFLLDGSTLEIGGYSGSVSEVLEQLEASDAILTPRLSAPLARDPGGRGERFRIEAEVAGRSQDGLR